MVDAMAISAAAMLVDDTSAAIRRPESFLEAEKINTVSPTHEKMQKTATQLELIDFMWSLLE